MSPIVITLTSVVALLLLAAPLTVEAQQAGQAVQTVGVLTPQRLEQQAGYPAFLETLRLLGYQEGSNLRMLLRSADGKLDRLPNLASELVGRKVDVLVTFGGTAPIAAATESEARALGLRFQCPKVTKAGDFDTVFQTAKKERAGAMLVTANPLIFTHFGRIAELAAKSRRPTIHPQREFVEAGGFMMYGPSEAEIYRRAAIYVDKILKGAKPAELPVERPTKFQ